MLGIDFSIVHHGCPSTISTLNYPEVKSRILSSNILYENEVTVLMHAGCQDHKKLNGFLTFWKDYDKVTKFTISARTGNEAVFTITMKDYTENVTRYILEYKGFFTIPVMVSGGAENWSIVLSDEDTKKALFTHLEEIGDVTINKIQKLDTLSMTLPLEYVSLTSKQMDALKKAYLHGYYEVPKKSSSRQVAELIGVSQSTFLEHLNKAEHKIISKLVHHI